MKKEFTVLYVLASIFILIYTCGFIFPDHFWSTHFINFIPSIFQILILVSIVWFSFRMIRSYDDTINIERLPINLKTISIITVLFMIATLIFSMVKDFYGDAYKFNSFLSKTPSVIPKGANEKFFTFELTPWAGEGTILAMVTYIAYYMEVTYKTAFLIFDTIFGGLYIFTWLHFLHKFVKTNRWKIILSLAGITAPFVLLFFGHIEIYAPIIFFHLLWIYLSFLYIKTEKSYLLWLLLFGLLINLKLHSISLLCIPALGILLWKRFKGAYPSWKQIGSFVITPIFIIGGVIYFFILEDHIDGRSLQKSAMAFDHIFLPLFSLDAPLDKYNLLSFNHFFDFSSLLFIWSPIATLIGLFLIITRRKKIDWNNPYIIFSGLCLLLFTMFFFMINPLLSLPIDWDLFSIPAPFLLVFITTLIIPLEKDNNLPSFKIISVAIIIAILSLPAFIVHQSEKSLSNRLESVAIYIYSTYYEWTAKTVDNAYSLDNKNHFNRLTRGEALLKKLKPLAKPEIDYEYCALLIDQGRYYLRTYKDSNKALELFYEAQKYAPSNNAKLLSLEAYFTLDQYDNAYKVSKELVQLQFPSPKKSLRINIHCSLTAGMYDNAYLSSKRYLKNWPNDPTIKEVFERLSNNDRIEELKFLFHNTNL